MMSKHIRAAGMVAVILIVVFLVLSLSAEKPADKPVPAPVAPHIEHIPAAPPEVVPPKADVATPPAPPVAEKPAAKAGPKTKSGKRVVRVRRKAQPAQVTSLADWRLGFLNGGL